MAGRYDKFAFVIASQNEARIAEQMHERGFRFIRSDDGHRLNAAQLVKGEKDLEFGLLGKREQRVGDGLSREIELDGFGAGEEWKKDTTAAPD